jgi:hypothetical protein
MGPNPVSTRRRGGMHEIQCARRGRNQSEINQLFRGFRDSGLNQRAIALKIGVHAMNVDRWIRSIQFGGTLSPIRCAGREITLSSLAGCVAVEVRHSPSGRPIPAGRVARLARERDPQWIEAAGSARDRVRFWVV